MLEKDISVATSTSSKVLMSGSIPWFTLKIFDRIELLEDIMNSFSDLNLSIIRELAVGWEYQVALWIRSSEVSGIFITYATVLEIHFPA